MLKDIVLKNFMEVISLVNKIAQIAEDLNHHPDIEIYNYKNLRVKTTTHEANGLTEKDYKLAEELNKIL